MDRNLRLTTNHSASRRSWIRAGALGLAVAGFGLALGVGTPQPAFAQVSGTSMSVPLAADAGECFAVGHVDEPLRAANAQRRAFRDRLRDLERAFEQRLIRDIAVIGALGVGVAAIGVVALIVIATLTFGR